MKKHPYFLTPLLLATLLSTTFPACAVDVETEQYNVNAAQKVVDKIKAELDEADARVNRQNQRIAQEQLVLKKLQQEQAAVKARYDKAQEALAGYQQMLDEAWKSRQGNKHD